MSWQWVTLVLVLALQLEIFLLVWFVLRNRHIEKVFVLENAPIMPRPPVSGDTMINPADENTVVEPPKGWPQGFTGSEPA